MSTQGRLHLHTAFTARGPGSTAIQVSTPEPYTGRVTAKGVRPRTRAGLHNRRVGFPMPLGNALRLQARGVRASRPAPTPNWAFAAGTRGFTAMPFKGFLGPSSEAADLTRILHRRLAGTVYHIPSEYASDHTKFSIYLQLIHNAPFPSRRSALCGPIKKLHSFHSHKPRRGRDIPGGLMKAHPRPPHIPEYPRAGNGGPCRLRPMY